MPSLFWWKTVWMVVTNDISPNFCTFSIKKRCSNDVIRRRSLGTIWVLFHSFQIHESNTESNRYDRYERQSPPQWNIEADTVLNGPVTHGESSQRHRELIFCDVGPWYRHVYQAQWGTGTFQREWRPQEPTSHSEDEHYSKMTIPESMRCSGTWTARWMYLWNPNVSF